MYAAVLDQRSTSPAPAPEGRRRPWRSRPCVWHTDPDLAQFTTPWEAVADFIDDGDTVARRIAPEVEATEPPTTDELVVLGGLEQRIDEAYRR